MTSADHLTTARTLIRQGWEQVAAAYAEEPSGIFEFGADRLLDFIHTGSDQALLDIATGTGAVALKAAARFDSSVRVIGCDIAEAMLRLASQMASDRGLSNVSFFRMDAEALGFADGSFDLATCAFSLFQFPDMHRALTEIARVVKPGGQVGLSNWGPGYFSPVANLQRGLFRDFGLHSLLTNPITFKKDEMRELLEGSGLIDVVLHAEDVCITFKDPQAVWDYNMSMGPFPMMLRSQLPASEREELHKRFIDMMEEIATETGIQCTFHTLYALAHNP